MKRMFFKAVPEGSLIEYGERQGIVFHNIKRSGYDTYHLMASKTVSSKSDIYAMWSFEKHEDLFTDKAALRRLYEQGYRYGWWVAESREVTLLDPKPVITIELLNPLMLL